MKKIIPFFAALISSGTAYAISVDTNTPKTITANKIEYNIKSETMKTSGKTEIVNQTGQRITLNDSYVSRNGKIDGQEIKIWLGNHVYVESENVTYELPKTVAIDAMFTACDGCDSYSNAWEISADKIVHNNDTKMIRFYNSVLWLYDIPVLWFPIFEMPDPSVKHKSGILIPDLKSTNKMGTQINLPIYMAFSDTHDATLTLSYLTKENPLFQIEHRLNGIHSEYRTKGAFTRNRAGENRWYIFNNDIIELGEYARASIYLERTSDKTFMQKYGFYGDQPFLDSGAKLELFSQSGYIVTDTHIFQEMRSISKYSKNTTIPSGDILPNIRGVYQTAPIYKETYALFNTDVLGISKDGTSSQRVIGDTRIISPWTLPFGNRVTASISARYDLYNFEHTDMIDGESFSGLKNRFLPSGYLEWGLPLMRPSDTWTQVIEPRARITMMRHINDDQFAINSDSAGALLSDATLFSNKRFSGLDLWENGTYADYGMRYAAFNQIGQMFELFFGQTYDFQNRETIDPNSGFHNGASDYVGRISFNNTKWFDINSRFRLAQENLSLNHIETSATIGNSKNYIDVGHIWSQQFIDAYTTGDNINELTAGMGVQLSERWAVRFNSIYNLTYERFQRHSGGLFYTHPCYYIALEYHRDNAIKEDYVGTTSYQFRFGMTIDGKKY